MLYVVAAFLGFVAGMIAWDATAAVQGKLLRYFVAFILGLLLCIALGFLFNVVVSAFHQMPKL